LFICGGTFVGLDEIIAKRLGKRTIGFGQPSGQRDEHNVGELLTSVCSDDILEFGMIPEFVGRLPVISALKPLDEKALVRVLTEPKNALVRQYQKLFSMESADLSFTDDALKAIARRALEKDTGARGLRSIIEEVMLDVMFDLPENQGARYVVTDEAVEGRQRIFPIVEAKKNSA
jgi:ATP-dependent Clp protease ATP-binding subunit ClpX